MPPSLRAARALLTKKGREAGGSFLIEGPTLLEEALRSGVEITALFATPQAYERYPFVRSFDDERLAITVPASLARLSAVERPSGLIAVARKRTVPLGSALAHEKLLLLAGLSDPGNVGTLLRSAHAFGVGGVLLLEDGVELYNPKIVRAAMGALFRLDCAVLSRANVDEALRDRPIIGADKEGAALETFCFPPRSVVVIGHERQGLREVPLRPTALVGIPQNPATESLNAAVAGSIILYAWSRQHPLSSLG
jgi:TrmH family RNA methyltransferase